MWTQKLTIGRIRRTSSPIHWYERVHVPCNHLSTAIQHSQSAQCLQLSTANWHSACNTAQPISTVLQLSTANQHSPCNTAQPISTVLTIQHSQPAQCLQHSTANQHWLNKHSSQSQDRSHTATRYQYNISPLMDKETNDNTFYKSKLWLTDLKVEADSAFVSCL